MNVPISYVPGFVTDPGTEFTKLWTELEWERRGSTPRREYYCNTEPVPYGYGVHAGYREYLPRAWHPSIVAIRTKVEDFLATELGVVFLNGYENSKDSLGWHADDSKEMDDEKPIAIVTLGAEREICESRRKSKLPRTVEHAKKPGAEFETVLGEDLVVIAFEAGAGMPPSPHAVGAFVRKLIAGHIIEWNGERRPLRKPKSHGRRSDVYGFMTENVRRTVDAESAANDPLANVAA